MCQVSTRTRTPHCGTAAPFHSLCGQLILFGLRGGARAASRRGAARSSEGGEMSYVNCPRCRLALRLGTDTLAPEHCPRCEAKHGVKEPLYLSALPSRLLKWPA